MKVEIRGAVSRLQSQLRKKGARQEGGKKVNKEVPHLMRRGSRKDVQAGQRLGPEDRASL